MCVAAQRERESKERAREQREREIIIAQIEREGCSSVVVSMSLEDLLAKGMCYRYANEGGLLLLLHCVAAVVTPAAEIGACRTVLLLLIYFPWLSAFRKGDCVHGTCREQQNLILAVDE